MFLENKSLYSSCVFYENIMEHHEKTILKLFEVLDISEDNLVDALQAFQADSQRDFFGSLNIQSVNAYSQVFAEMDKEFKGSSIRVSTTMSMEEFYKLF